MEHTPLIDLPDLTEVSPLADAEIAAYQEHCHINVSGACDVGNEGSIQA